LSDFEKNKNNQELGHVSSMFLVIWKWDVNKWWIEASGSQEIPETL
jgi:hypothetical protein